MHAGPWLKSFGWGTDELVSPEEIYPAVSAEEAAKMPTVAWKRDAAQVGEGATAAQGRQCVTRGQLRRKQGPLLKYSNISASLLLPGSHQICTIGSALQAADNDGSALGTVGVHRRYRAKCGMNMGMLVPGYSSKHIKV